MTSPTAKPVQTTVPPSANPMILKGAEVVAGAAGANKEPATSATEETALVTKGETPHFVLKAPPAAPPPSEKRRLTVDQLSYMRDQMPLPRNDADEATCELPDHTAPFRLRGHPCKSRPDLEKADHFRWRVLDVEPVL